MREVKNKNIVYRRKNYTHAKRISTNILKYNLEKPSNMKNNIGKYVTNISKLSDIKIKIKSIEKQYRKAIKAGRATVKIKKSLNKYKNDLKIVTNKALRDFKVDEPLLKVNKNKYEINLDVAVKAKVKTKRVFCGIDPYEFRTAFIATNAWYHLASFMFWGGTDWHWRTLSPLGFDNLNDFVVSLLECLQIWQSPPVDKVIIRKAKEIIKYKY